eukprot:scaffold24937_cov65-Attheya_sp.AAC.1
MPAPDTTPLLPAGEQTALQEIVGTFLYYARAIDSTMLMALNSLASQQNKGTENTAKQITHFLNYCATHQDATLTFYKSDMVLYFTAMLLIAPNPGPAAGMEVTSILDQILKTPPSPRKACRHSTVPSILNAVSCAMYWHLPWNQRWGDCSTTVNKVSPYEFHSKK